LIGQNDDTGVREMA